MSVSQSDGTSQTGATTSTTSSSSSTTPCSSNMSITSGSQSSFEETTASVPVGGTSSIPPDTCSSCVTTAEARTPVNMWNPPIYILGNGEFLHDKVGACQSTKTLTSFSKSLTVQNVYRIFFNYTTVLQRDSKRCTTAYKRHTNLNRYADIPCYEETRVKVKHTKDDHDYIHANYVDGYRTKNKYILAQSPLPGELSHWWRMIVQEKVCIIACMVEMDEKQCPLYIPKKTGETLQFDDCTVEHGGTTIVRDQYDATNLFVNDGKHQRHILHLTFYGWTNKGSPTRPTELLNFINDINHNYDILIDEAEGLGWLTRDDLSPWLLHCHSGASRSATLVAIDICCRRMDDTQETDGEGLVDPEETVLKLRTQRAMAVQMPEQFLFIHLSVFEHAIRRRLLGEVEELNVSNFKMTTSE